MSDVLLTRYIEHLTLADREGALAVAETMAADEAGVRGVVERLLVPAQREVGRRWERNEWTVPQEHAATAISEWVLDTVSAQHAAEKATVTRGRLAAVCAEGEWHSLPLRVLTEVVQRAGWDVTVLGPSVSSTQLARFLHDEGPDGVLVSCSIPFNLVGARRMIEATRATGTPVMVGGRAFDLHGRRAATLGADAWAPDAQSAVDLLDSWHPFTTAAPPLKHAGMAEHVHIDRTRQDLVADSMQALRARFPSMSAYDAAQLERTEEDLEYLFRFLSSALLVDDAHLMLDYIRWLDVVLTSRGVPREAVPAGTEAALEVTTELPVATTMLREAIRRWRTDLPPDA